MASDSVVWKFSSWKYWSLFLWQGGGAYSKSECRRVHSHAGNISAKWHYVLVCCDSNKIFCPNHNSCSHSMNFRESPQNGVSRQTHFLFRGYNLACQLNWSWSTRLLPLVLRQKWGKRNPFCQDWWLELEKFGSAFKEPIKKCYNVLRQPFHWDRRSVLNDMVATHKVSRSISNDSDKFSRICKVLDSVDKNSTLCRKIIFNF